MKLGVIGYGNRIQDVITKIMKEDNACHIAAISDIRKHEIQQERLPQLMDTLFYDTPEEMMASTQLDGILIGTRCLLHTEMALKVLPTGIPLFLEKPVATTMQDLRRLKAGNDHYKSPVVVSFPLRVTSIVQWVKEIVDSGKIGTVEHVQAINNVPYGGVYFHNWYRDESLTGGLFLQKATHDFDYINHVLQMQPVSVCAMTSKQIFKGDKPAGLKCVDCTENRTCEESTAFAEPDIRDRWAYCSFAKDTGNEDSGSALIHYENGMHVSYSQNFFARKQAASRGARFLGYKGTVEFDFFTGSVKVFMHHTSRVETYEIDASQDHFGGDRMLASNFIELMQGRNTSISTLDDGLISALQCLKARKSAETRTFQTIDWS
ncbi:4,5-dihydroxyphthalate dehydrogenase [Paenibacillus marchantiophytorum]|uniref:4,5-dihydroxyphthalate dehydrogenase n=1 Tax=Paenibacillus marchantiophytorum TaxID=1619310 RepID=A0ABQ1FFX0_9BACL|nr:Gfo/Idh/MocA family oxidoreductase [Paenibacillus marchantiophytorum]GGA09596.1 4,5-dihydroxyphthalate dehydrogenase [Paenibacillus marchantiophytorum]